MKRRGGFTWIEFLVVVVICGVLAAILLPAFHRPHGHGYERRTRCASNLRYLGSAMMQYIQENDERLVPAILDSKPKIVFRNSTPPFYEALPPFGWADAIYPFVADPARYQCVSESRVVNRAVKPTQSGYTDYWYNSNLSKLKFERLKAPSKTIMFGEGNDGTGNTNARYSLNSLPQAWRNMESSPAVRHLDRANYAFADGHVKAVTPDEIQISPTTQSLYTFSLR